MTDPIYKILERMSQITDDLTPTSVKGGLNPQQKKVHQLPALFKASRISPVLGADSDPKHPAADYFVGAESLETEEVAVEDVVSPQRPRLMDYIHSAEERHRDRDLLQRARDRDITAKARDRDLLPRTNIRESSVKTVTVENGQPFEIYGDQGRGFQIGRGSKRMPSKFATLDEAVMAVEVYQAMRGAVADDHSNSDYIEEK